MSYLVRGDSRRLLYSPHLNGRTLVISFMTLAELARWTEKYRWGAQRRAALDAHRRRFIVRHSDDNLCRHWAAIRTETERVGRIIPEGDAWQAATARLYGIPLVTHNRRHYAAVPGLTIISEAPA